jgi:hypothetical protein
MTARTRWVETPPEGWDVLRREDSNGTPLHRPELVRALVEPLSGCTAAFVLVEEADGSLIGGAPVVLERRFGLEWLRAMPFTLPGAPLARASAHPLVDRMVADALADSARERRVVGGEWGLDRPAGPPLEVGTVAQIAGETRVSETDVVDLTEGASAAYRRLDRKTRESVAASVDRGLRCAEEPEALDEIYALYGIQARGWRGHRMKPVTMLRRLLAGETPAARLFTVRDSRGLLSGALALVGEHEWLMWWSGSHPDSRRHQAFATLAWCMIESAARAGATRFNLGASAGLENVASFKKAMGARSLPVPIRWIGADYASPWGKTVAALQRRRHAGRWRGAPS